MRWLNDYDPQHRPADAAERRALRSLVSLAASGRSVAVTRRMRVVVVGVVLAQQILAVVVAIGGAHDGMDMVARGGVVVVHDAGLVVELDKDHRAQDAIIERAGVVEPADPGEMRVA